MDASPYVGMFAGQDDQCWELVRIVLSREYGVELPRYQKIIPKRDGHQYLERATVNHDEWECVEPPYQEGDLCFFKVGRSLHVGIAVNEHKMLHAANKMGAVTMDLRLPLWERTRIGVYRRRPE